MNKMVTAFLNAKKYDGFSEHTDYVYLNNLIKNTIQQTMDVRKTAWCAAFVGAILEANGIPSTKKLNARSYLKWGVPVELHKADFGDVVVFKRGIIPWQGHVAFYASRGVDYIRVFGGNQNDKVCYKNYPLNKLLGIRRFV